MKVRSRVFTSSRFVGWLAGGGVRALNVDLHFALAANGAGYRLVAAFARVDVVVAVSFAAVDRDPHILEQRAILVLELRGVGGADREYGAALLDLREGEFGRLLLDRCRDHGTGRRGERAPLAHGALR